MVSHLLARPGTLSLDAVSLFLMGAARVGFEHVQFMRAALTRYTPAAIACADFNQIEHLLYYCTRMAQRLPPPTLAACCRRLLLLLPRLRVEELHRLLYLLTLRHASTGAPSGIEELELQRAVVGQALAVLQSGAWSEQRRQQLLACLVVLIGGNGMVPGFGMMPGAGLVPGAFPTGPDAGLQAVAAAGGSLVDPMDMGLEKGSQDGDAM